MPNTVGCCDRLLWVSSSLSVVYQLRGWFRPEADDQKYFHDFFLKICSDPESRRSKLSSATSATSKWALIPRFRQDAVIHLVSK